ncbi:MAG TPA: hypothetical protein VG457_10385 [Planctomycetota bacterium]|nr:hypothetical protein [Planctomycetota bacterium]
MGKKLAWTVALLALVSLGFLAGIGIGRRRSNAPTSVSSTTPSPSRGVGLPGKSEAPANPSGGRPGDVEGPLWGKEERDPVSLDREETADRRQGTVPREPRDPAGADDPSLLLARGGQTFKISGKVSFPGPAPTVKRNRSLAADPLCSALHAEPPDRDDFVVSPQGGVRWALVFIQSGLGGRHFDPPAEPVLIDQVGCTYVPHVAGVMVGQSLVFRNSDPLLHNVHGFPFVNREFNFGQPRGTVNALKFAAPEVMVKVACDIHPFMSAWIGVLDHPFFAVTDGFGNFAISDVPAGKYTIAAWHEKLRFMDQKLVLTRDHRVEFSGLMK